MPFNASEHGHSGVHGMFFVALLCMVLNKNERGSFRPGARGSSIGVFLWPDLARAPRTKPKPTPTHCPGAVGVQAEVQYKLPFLGFLPEKVLLAQDFRSCSLRSQLAPRSAKSRSGCSAFLFTGEDTNERRRGKARNKKKQIPYHYTIVWYNP